MNSILRVMWRITATSSSNNIRIASKRGSPIEKGQRVRKRTLCLFFYCNPEKDEVSVLELLYFVLCPQYSCASLEIGSTRFLEWVYLIFEEGLPDSVGACPLCKAGGPSGGG